jgi:hypothetical protein
VSPVRYELGFRIPEDGILHSHHRENTRLAELAPVFRIRVGPNCAFPPQIPHDLTLD